MVATAAAEIESQNTTALLLHVFDDDELSSTRENIDSDGSVTVDGLAARKSSITTAKKILEDVNIGVEIRGIEHVGEPADGILSMVDEADIDRLYLYGRKRSQTGKAVFGSTLQRVLLNAPVPVTVVPASLSE